jgi:DNA sulfur modification protein DndB
MEHPILSKETALSKSQTGAISNGDNSSFTTLVTIYNINKKLYSKPKTFYTSRPTQLVIEELYAKSNLFWNFFFKTFPEIDHYIDGVNNIMLNETPIYRSSESGGSLLLRPVGQELIANAFTRFDDNELDEFSKKLKKINFNLSGNTWKYIFWNGRMLAGNAKLKSNLLLFLLGKYNNPNEIHNEMTKLYELNNQVYYNHIQQVKIPS